MSYLDRDMLGMYRNDTGPGPALMGADTLIGDDVYNHDDEQLGDIKEIMLDMRSGRIAYAVLSFGGVLGLGEKLFAVPWEKLTLDTVNKRFLLDVGQGTIEKRPRLRQGQLARHGQRSVERPDEPVLRHHLALWHRRHEHHGRPGRWQHVLRQRPARRRQPAVGHERQHVGLVDERQPGRDRDR